MAANWTSFLPQATKWVSGLGLHSLYGHPHKAKKPKKIKIARAHHANHLLSHGIHPTAMPKMGPAPRGVKTLVKRKRG